jgi:DNA gyrase subunit B/topoisomerase-4 subunit B
VGANVVNALSTGLCARVKRDGSNGRCFKRARFRALKKVARGGSGTSVYFHPDSTIFPKVEFDPALIRERLEIVSYLHKGVKVTFEDEGAKAKSSARRGHRSS